MFLKEGLTWDDVENDIMDVDFEKDVDYTMGDGFMNNMQKINAIQDQTPRSIDPFTISTNLVRTELANDSNIQMFDEVVKMDNHALISLISGRFPSARLNVKSIKTDPEYPDCPYFNISGSNYKNNKFVEIAYKNEKNDGTIVSLRQLISDAIKADDSLFQFLSKLQDYCIKHNVLIPQKIGGDIFKQDDDEAKEIVNMALKHIFDEIKSTQREVSKFYYIWDGMIQNQSCRQIYDALINEVVNAWGLMEILPPYTEYEILIDYKKLSDELIRCVNYMSQKGNVCRGDAGKLQAFVRRWYRTIIAKVTSQFIGSMEFKTYKGLFSKTLAKTLSDYRTALMDLYIVYDKDTKKPLLYVVSCVDDTHVMIPNPLAGGNILDAHLQKKENYAKQANGDIFTRMQSTTYIRNLVKGTLNFMMGNDERKMFRYVMDKGFEYSKVSFRRDVSDDKLPDDLGVFKRKDIQLLKGYDCLDGVVAWGDATIGGQIPYPVNILDANIFTTDTDMLDKVRIYPKNGMRIYSYYTLGQFNEDKLRKLIKLDAQGQQNDGMSEEEIVEQVAVIQDSVVKLQDYINDSLLSNPRNILVYSYNNAPYEYKGKKENAIQKGNAIFKVFVNDTDYFYMCIYGYVFNEEYNSFLKVDKNKEYYMFDAFNSKNKDNYRPVVFIQPKKGYYKK